jgi:hypothetical protein
MSRHAKAERAKSSSQLIGHIDPEAESISSGVTVRGCGEAVAFGAKERGNLVMGGRKYLRFYRNFGKDTE